MKKTEALGVFAACVFALLGFMESGMVAAVGVMIFGIFSIMVLMAEEENKRKRYARTKKALLRWQLRKKYL